MLLDMLTDCPKYLWVSNVILLSEVCSEPGRVTARSPLTLYFCQPERPMVMHLQQDFCSVLIILVDKKRKEMGMQGSEHRWRSAARTEGNTGLEIKMVLKLQKVTEIDSLNVGKGTFHSKCEVCIKI